LACVLRLPIVQRWIRCIGLQVGTGGCAIEVMGGGQVVNTSERACCGADRKGSCATPVVCIVDGDAAVRRCLDALVCAAGWQPRSFASAEELLAEPLIPCPACVVVSVELPGLSGLELQRRLADRPEISVIFASAQSNVEVTVRAMKAGAVDYLTKPVARESLLRAIAEGIDRSRARVEREAELRALRTQYDSLSSRERQVMDLVIRGRLNKQAADDLGISEITVKAHRGRVMRKMRVSSLADLVRAGERLGPRLFVARGDLVR